MISKPSLKLSTTAAADDGRPTLVRVRSHIAFGAPTKQDTAGSARRTARRRRGAGHQGRLWVAGRGDLSRAAGGREHCREAVQRGAEARRAWVADGGRKHGPAATPTSQREWQRRLERELPEGWTSSPLPTFEDDAKIATRGASGTVLNAIAARAPRADRRIRGPRAVEQDAHRGGGDLQATRRQSKYPLRDSRARHGGHAQRHGCTGNCGPSAAPSWCSPITCGRRSGWRRSWSSR